MVQRILLILAAFLALAPVSAMAARHALVIGIDNYENIAPLEKALNDANAVGKTLKGLDFDVTVVLDPGRRQINQALSRFVANLTPQDEVLFYFAGHGVEMDGRNYLIPADEPKIGADDQALLISESIAVDQVLGTLTASGARVTIMILDACRDNPFPRKGTRSVGTERGLAPIAAPEGTFILYSARAGQTALDRLSATDSNPNSVFTRVLLPLLQTPGLDHRDLAGALRNGVQELALSVGHDQFPSYYDEIAGKFTFDEKPALQTPAPPAPVVVAPDDPCDKARADWALVSNSGSEAILQAYAKTYSDCAIFAGLAQERMLSLTVPPPPTKPEKPDLTAKIKALQTDLKARGCYSGPIDGTLGTATQSALAAFAKAADTEFAIANDPTDDELGATAAALAESSAQCSPPPKLITKPQTTAKPQKCYVFGGKTLCE